MAADRLFMFCCSASVRRAMWRTVPQLARQVRGLGFRMAELPATRYAGAPRWFSRMAG